jgi:hypothetical protein
MSSDNENISYEINDNGEELLEETELFTLLKKLDTVGTGVITNNDEDVIFVEMKNYDLNYTLKQLLLICEYYNILKGVRINKLKKQDVIEQIIMFENDMENYEIVAKRKQLWYFINELKEDKFMKKFVIWA